MSTRMTLRSFAIKRCKTAAELPIDVILLILLKLPVESLLRFSCASKSWLSLISSPDFSETHINNNSNNNNRVLLSFAGKYLDHCSIPYFLSTSIIHHPKKKKDPNLPNATTIIGSRDGLICLLLDFSDTKKQIVVWNPSTRKRKTLPDFRVPFPHLRNCVFGFDFDHSINNYKVVGIFDDVYFTIVKVYSFATRRWKRIKLKTSDIKVQWVLPLSYKRQPAPFRNGKFYWLHYVIKSKEDYVTTVGYFDVEKDEFQGRMIEMPAEPDHSWFYQRLAVCEPNHIHVLRGCDEYTSVWVLKERERVWTRLCIINHATCDRPDLPLYYKISPFFVLTNGEIVLLSETKFITKFIIYNPNDCSIRYSEFKSPVPVAACTYVESLISI